MPNTTNSVFGMIETKSVKLEQRSMPGRRVRCNIIILHLQNLILSHNLKLRRNPTHVTMNNVSTQHKQLIFCTNSNMQPQHKSNHHILPHAIQPQPSHISPPNSINSAMVIQNPNNDQYQHPPTTPSYIKENRNLASMTSW